MPADDGVRLHDHQRRAQVSPTSRGDTRAADRPRGGLDTVSWAKLVGSAPKRIRRVKGPFAVTRANGPFPRHAPMVDRPTPLPETRPARSASTKLTPQQPVLFEEMCDDVPLPAIQPAGQRHQHHLQRGEVDHEPERTSRLARRMSAELWNTTPSRIRRTRAHLISAHPAFSVARPDARIPASSVRPVAAPALPTPIPSAIKFQAPREP